MRRDLRSAVWIIRPLHMRRSPCHMRPSALKEESDSSSNLTHGLAAFLLRVAAYFQGCLASLPRVMSSYEQRATSQEIVQEGLQESVTVMDPALEGSSEPLVKVRMNRAGRNPNRGGVLGLGMAATCAAPLSPD